MLNQRQRESLLEWAYYHCCALSLQRTAMTCDRHLSGCRPKQYVPKSPEEVVDQALGAIRRGYKDGIYRQQIELLLPLIGATDLDDWHALTPYRILWPPDQYRFTHRSNPLCLMRHHACVPA